MQFINVERIQEIIKESETDNESRLEENHKELAALYEANAFACGIAPQSENYIRFSVGFAGVVSPTLLNYDKTRNWEYIKLDKAHRDRILDISSHTVRAGVTSLISTLSSSLNPEQIGGAIALNKYIESANLWPKEDWINIEY